LPKLVLLTLLVLVLVSSVAASAAAIDVDGGRLSVFHLDVPPLASLRAHVDIRPDSLQVTSKGEPVMAFVELPSPYRVEDIDPSTIRLCRGKDPCAGGPAASGKAKVGDEDGDGVPDLKVSFDRAKVIGMVRDLVPPALLTLTVVGGSRDGRFTFVGNDTIKLISADQSKSMRTPGEIAINSQALEPAGSSTTTKPGTQKR